MTAKQRSIVRFAVSLLRHMVRNNDNVKAGTMIEAIEATVGPDNPLHGVTDADLAEIESLLLAPGPNAPDAAGAELTDAIKRLDEVHQTLKEAEIGQHPAPKDP